MTQVASLTFSPISENTYVLFDETKECVIIDPGCYDQAERQQLVDFIEAAGLKPVRLLNTHCHLDHIFGNKFVCEKYPSRPIITSQADNNFTVDLFKIATHTNHS